VAHADGQPDRGLDSVDVDVDAEVEVEVDVDVDAEVEVDVAALLARCTFPSPGAPLSCAVSGGADSVALLLLAVSAGLEVTAIHVDHGLRPGSADEALFVESVANDHGARFLAERVAVPPGPNLEARARAARYAALPADVATGHTADDQAETVLLNLLRGAGVPGLAAMRRGLRHPILGLRRAETRALCAASGIAPLRDPMNRDPAYRRVRVRHEVVPLLDDVAARDVVPLLARQADLAADAVDALDACVAPIDPTDVRALRAAPVALARWALRRWIRETTGAEHPVDAAALDRVLAVVALEVRATQIEGGWRVARTAGRLRLERPEASQR
jgi:tRNA(Ile)-lysidine synthase